MNEVRNDAADLVCVLTVRCESQALKIAASAAQAKSHR